MVDGIAAGARAFASFEDLRAACLDLPPGDFKSAAVALERQIGPRQIIGGDHFGFALVTEGDAQAGKPK